MQAMELADVIDALDLPADSTIDAVKADLDRRLVELRKQQDNAGSKPERLMARDAIKKLVAMQEVVGQCLKSQQARELYDLARDDMDAGRAAAAAVRLRKAQALIESGAAQEIATDVEALLAEAAVGPAPAEPEPAPEPEPEVEPEPVSEPTPPATSAASVGEDGAGGDEPALSAVEPELRSVVPDTDVIIPPVTACQCLTLRMDSTGRHLHIHTADSVLFGRERSNHFPLRAYDPVDTKSADEISRLISRRHFRIERAGNEVLLMDGEARESGDNRPSANGSFWNASRIICQQLARVADGDLQVASHIPDFRSPRWRVHVIHPSALPVFFPARPDAPPAILMRRLDGPGDDILLLWFGCHGEVKGEANTLPSTLVANGGILFFDGSEWQDSADFTPPNTHCLSRGVLTFSQAF